MASGVTGSEEGVAVNGKTSQPSGTTGILPAVNSQLMSTLARVWTPRVTPELQSAGSTPPRLVQALVGAGSRDPAEGLHFDCLQTLHRRKAPARSGLERHPHFGDSAPLPRMRSNG